MSSRTSKQPKNVNNWAQTYCGGSEVFGSSGCTATECVCEASRLTKLFNYGLHYNLLMEVDKFHIDNTLARQDTHVLKKLIGKVPDLKLHFSKNEGIWQAFAASVQNLNLVEAGTTKLKEKYIRATQQEWHRRYPGMYPSVGALLTANPGLLNKPDTSNYDRLMFRMALESEQMTDKLSQKSEQDLKRKEILDQTSETLFSRQFNNKNKPSFDDLDSAHVLLKGVDSVGRSGGNIGIQFGEEGYHVNEFRDVYGGASSSSAVSVSSKPARKRSRSHEEVAGDSDDADNLAGDPDEDYIKIGMGLGSRYSRSSEHNEPEEHQEMPEKMKGKLPSRDAGENDTEDDQRKSSKRFTGLLSPEFGSDLERIGADVAASAKTIAQSRMRSLAVQEKNAEARLQEAKNTAIMVELLREFKK
jgi:hypothetical protein